MGALLMALRVRGETVEEITGAVTAMRAKMLRVAGAAGRHRRRRHRRRRVGFVQYFHLRGADRRRRRRSGRQARQSRIVVALRRGRRARRARRQYRSHARADRPLHPRGRDRLHVRAGASSGDEECRRRRASSSAPARSSICSGRCPIRPACAGRWSACFPSNGPSRWRKCLKNLGAESVWVVHGSDGLDEITTSGPTSVTALEERRHQKLRDFAGRGRPAARSSRKRCAAAMRRPMPRRWKTSWKASPRRSAMSRC